MSTYIKKAKALRNDTTTHYSCCQSVVMAFADVAGVTDELCFKAADNFGGGMRIAATCGAMTGALMALGLCGVGDPSVVTSFFRTLKERHQGCLDCADLLRINKELGNEKKPHCDAMVYECVELVESILREKGKIE